MAEYELEQGGLRDRPSVTAKVYISATLRSFFDRRTEVEAKGHTVREILKDLQRQYPDGAKLMFDENGGLKGFIRIYAGEEDKTDVSLWDDDISGASGILLLPLVAGGAPQEALISDERRKAESLDDEEVERFNKHLLLREIGVKGQKRIKAARVVVAGAGALGSPVIQYLAAAGVGTIKVVDFDQVTLGNLQSQVIHGVRDVKRPKAASARDTIRNINRKLNVEVEQARLSADNIRSVIEGYDLVIDCTDNYQTRYLINDACVLSGIPFVFGAIYQYEGMVSVFHYRGGPCLRCLFPAPPAPGLVPTCAEGGTISPLSGIIGSIQANEALKLIMGIGEHLDGRLLRVDTLGLHNDLVRVEKNCGCPVCGDQPTITEVWDFDYEEFCGLKEDEQEEPVEGFTPEELAHRIEANEPIRLIDVREPHERAILRFPGATAIPIGQLARRKGELDPEQDTIFICKEGKRSILAIRTLREAGYKGPMYNLKGGIDAMKDIIFSNEGGWL